MSYPIMISQEELAEYGISFPEDVSAKKFLYYLHRAFYENVIFVSERNWRTRVIEAHKEELEQAVKQILVDIALSVDESGDFNGLWDGKTRIDTGGFEIKDLQERITAIIPPMTWNAIFALEPDLLFCGGDI